MLHHELSQFWLRLDLFEQALSGRSLSQVGPDKSILLSLHSRVIAAQLLNDRSSKVQRDLKGLVRSHGSKKYLIVPLLQLVNHLTEEPQSDALGCVLRQYGPIDTIDGNSGFVVGLEKFILYLLDVPPLIADEFGLSLQPGGVFEFGIVIHVVVDAHADHPVLEVQNVGEAVLDAVLQFIVKDGIDLLICGFLLLVDSVDFDETFRHGVAGLLDVIHGDAFKPVIVNH